MPDSHTKPVAPLSDEAVAEIEARASAATEGPWSAHHRISPRGAHKQWHIGNEQGLCQITMSGHERDYQFMAHARTDIPALCQTVRALKEANKALARDVVTATNQAHRYRDEADALREQLAENARRHFDDARSLEQQRDELQSRLAEVEKERNEFKRRLKEWEL